MFLLGGTLLFANVLKANVKNRISFLPWWAKTALESSCSQRILQTCFVRILCMSSRIILGF